MEPLLQVARALRAAGARLGATLTVAPSRKRHESASEDERLEQCRQAFAQCDRDGNQTIDKDELQEVLDKLGYPCTPDELDRLMERMDVDGNGTIDFEEFAAVMVHREEEEEMEKELEDMAAVFQSFDKDGSGQLSVDELRRALDILGVQMSQGETELLMREIDSSGDGEISYEEFIEYVLKFEADADMGASDH